jgi:hypothetical protein
LKAELEYWTAQLVLERARADEAEAWAEEMAAQALLAKIRADEAEARAAQWVEIESQKWIGG